MICERCAQPISDGQLYQTGIYLMGGPHEVDGSSIQSARSVHVDCPRDPIKRAFDALQRAGFGT